MQCPRHLHSKGYKGTGLSQGLNSCRTSKRGIADKPQCPSNSFRLQILIAFTIESGKPSAYFILLGLIFLLEQILYFCEAIAGKHFKVCPLGKARMEEKMPSTLWLLSLSPPSRNTLHTDRAHQSIQNPLNIVECTGSTQSECALIKTRKLLGDYSSENSECNRRELRTLEIYFLESVWNSVGIETSAQSGAAVLTTM